MTNLLLTLAAGFVAGLGVASATDLMLFGQSDRMARKKLAQNKLKYETKISKLERSLSAFKNAPTAEHRVGRPDTIIMTARLPPRVAGED